MQVRIKTTNGLIPSNLTIGKIYNATRIDDHRMRLTCDDGQVICTNIEKSGYLGDGDAGGEWELIDIEL
ncbi:MAG: hypothetical protein J5965_20580 [Aeriscardovia sp.]|nr:hypothetical protein [Aeriscardovia sp.]